MWEIPPENRVSGAERQSARAPLKTDGEPPLARPRGGPTALELACYVNEPGERERAAGCRAVADCAQQCQQRAIERRRDAMLLARRDDGPGQCLDFQPTAGERVEVHRGPQVVGDAEQGCEGSLRCVWSQPRPFGPTNRGRLFQHCEAEHPHVIAAQDHLALPGERGERVGDRIDEQLAPQ